jgi:hypothetical protein
VARLGTHGLGHQPAQPLEIDQPGDLAAEPGRSGRKENGILECGSERF